MSDTRHHFSCCHCTKCMIPEEKMVISQAFLSYLSIFWCKNRHCQCHDHGTRMGIGNISPIAKDVYFEYIGTCYLSNGKLNQKDK